MLAIELEKEPEILIEISNFKTLQFLLATSLLQSKQVRTKSSDRTYIFLSEYFSWTVFDGTCKNLEKVSRLFLLFFN